MKSFFDLFCRLIMLVLTVRLAAAPSIEISTGSPASPVRLSLPVEERVATRAPQAPDLATAYWVVTPLPVVVRSGSAYYGAVRSINAHGDVLGNDLSVIKHIAADGTVSELGSHNFHFNGGRQLDDAGRVVLNTKFGNEGLLFTVAGASPSVGVRYPGTRLTSLDNAGGLLGVTLSQTVQSDQDYWGLHFVEREDRRRDLELPADSNFGADLMALNERDEVVGGAFQIPGNRWRGLYLKPGRAPRWLPGFGQYEDAYNLNVHGQLVGSTSVPAGFGYAPGVYPALWDSGAVGRVKVLDTDRSLFGGEYGWAWAANRWGHIVGRTRSGGALWLDGQPHDLTGRIINPDNIRLDYFADINDKGEIVGAEYGFLTSPRTFVMRPVWPSLAVDLNRDGRIALPFDGDKSDVTSAAMPFRFWINDDDDDGDLSNNDVPGQLPSVNGGMVAAPGADWRTLHNEGVVDGTADLIDFFPVFLDIKQLLVALPHTTDGVTYKLKHGEGALNFVYTGLLRTEAFHYLKHARERAAYGTPGSETLPQDAKTVAITEVGVVLNPDFLACIKDETEKGVILIECRQPTTAPLRLVVEKDGAEIAGVSLQLEISPVEDMYRWINLRSVCGQSETRPSNLGPPPAYPDNLTNGRMFIWVHGYNVNERQSRGWGAEVFKRMWHSGSRAMFTAVSWHGDYSQIQSVGVAPDYWDNIPNAFLTGEALSPLVNALPGFSKVIAGHSMGNVVVSSSIKDHGMNVAKYLMVNAAVALEAYDASVLTMGPYFVNAMRPIEWADYDRRLFSADWWQLFPEGDNRRRLTWVNRFGDIPNAINIYSSGEEVLNNNDSNPGHLPYTILPLGAERIWVQQEMSKGGGSAAGTLAGLLNGEIQGGWGFNEAWGSQIWVPDPLNGSGSFVYVPPTVAEANVLTDTQIRAKPFFTAFDNLSLMHSDVGAGSLGSAAADDATRADLLGGAIPALSFPAGRNPVPLFGNRNRDLMTCQDGWPESRLSSQNKGNRWLHSDLRDVAYYFSYDAWDLFTTEGNLR